jgi:hypothetical protein
MGMGALPPVPRWRDLPRDVSGSMETGAARTVPPPCVSDPSEPPPPTAVIGVPACTARAGSRPKVKKALSRLHRP